MSKPYEYVTDLFNKLRADIAEIKRRLFVEKPKAESSADAPRQYSIEAVHADHHAREKADGPEQVVRATLRLPETLRVKAETEERQKEWYRDRAFKLSIAGVLVGIGVAVIYFSQLREMQKQTKAITRQMLISERAWITPSVAIDNTIERNRPFGVEIHMENTGQTAAKQVHSQVVVKIVPSTQTPVFDYDHAVINRLQGLMFPKSTNDQLVGIENDSPQPLTEIDFERLQDGDAYVVTYMRIDYFDVFGKARWLTTCYWHGFKEHAVYYSRDCVRYSNVDED
jgi:hypothetical protein